MSLSRDLHFSIVLPPQDVVGGLCKGDRRMVADVVAKQCRIGDQDVCRTSLHFLLGSDEEAARGVTRLLLLAFELVSRANKSENKAGESLTSCNLVLVLAGVLREP